MPAIGYFTKFKKSSQVATGDGWAKHAGNSDDHRRANRLLRRRLKLALQKEAE